ncbi:MAG: enoyl-CoA hydratase/isomerase family protein [Mycobacterium sp.]|uniref:enoyl-CoA hydratase/isomerase family protein n=1 Tax=Mycobacterium sp. TaxID=1785 RepID=UPI003F9EB5CC
MSQTRHGAGTTPPAAELRTAGLSFSARDSVAEIVLCNPARRNAQTPAMWRALAALARAMPADVRVLVIRAEGPSFSAGLDRSMLDGATDGETVAGLVDGTDLAMARTIDEYQAGFTFLRDPSFISIAAVQGHAMGAGFQLALACDIRILAEDAVFCMKETALGLVPDLTGLTPLVRQVGYARALEICVQARNVDAREALTLGLAHSVVPKEDLEREVDTLTHSLLQSDADAARETKRLLQSAETLDLEHQRHLESAAQIRRLRAIAANRDLPKASR